MAGPCGEPAGAADETAAPKGAVMLREFILVNVERKTMNRRFRVVSIWALLGWMGVLPLPNWTLTAVPLCAPSALRSAQTSATWAALYGGDGAEEMEGVWPTSDGGFLVAGSTDSYGNGSGDAWLVKLDAGGAVEWQKTYGGPDDEYALDVRQTPDGGYVVAGWTNSFGAGQADFWVFRLDAAGEIRWQKTYGGPGIEQAWSVEPTSDGGYIVAGGTTSFGAGGADYWVLKLDADGNIRWQKTYGGPADDGGGGDFEELVVRVLEDADGNYVVAGETFSFGHGESDIWVLKLDAGGDILWQKAYGGPYEDTMWSFQEAANGGYLVPGVTVSFSPDGSGDLWALRLDKNGDIQWQKIYGVAGYWDEALSVGATSDGGALIGGYYEEGTQDWDLFLLRVDADGDALWQKLFEYGWDWPNAIQPLEDGGAIVAGVVWPREQHLDLELLVMRLASDGSIGPSCPHLMDLSLVQAVTQSAPLPTNAVVQATHVTPQDSSAKVQDTSAVPNYLCGEASGGPAAFRVTQQGDVYSDGTFFCGLPEGCFNAGRGADIAEWVLISEEVVPGDVLELDPEHPGRYRKTRRPYSRLVAGVVASSPGIVLGELQAERKALLGLMGTVSVKAAAENGPIRPGDLLVSASRPGYVMRCDERERCLGAMVGKALEPLEEGAGIIRMLVMH